MSGWAAATKSGPWSRMVRFLAGLGMVASAVLLIHHFFAINVPFPGFESSVWDSHRFFNCERLACSTVGQVRGVPLGYFGLVFGCLIALGAVFPTTGLVRTNRTLAVLNLAGAVGVLSYSLLGLKSLCLLWLGYFVFAAVSLVVLGKHRLDRDGENSLRKYLYPSLKHLAVIAVLTLSGAYGFSLYHVAIRDARGIEWYPGFVERYFDLPKVKMPSMVSPFMLIRSTEKFEDARLRVVVYGDFLCSDSRYLARQLARLAEEFEGKLNVAYQFFPLDSECNDVVDKDIHPGACELSYISAQDPTKFKAIHDEIFANLPAARDPEWRIELARRHGLEHALDDLGTKELVHQLIRTGAEYEPTSDQYPFGIRSTPTLILNGRMIIGTLPYAQIRAIFRAVLIRGEEEAREEFLEYWMPPES